MWSYEGMKYPDIGPQMLKHKTLGPIMRADLKLLGAEELYQFLDAIAAKKSIKFLYINFISDEGRYPLNISSQMRTQMKSAAEMGDFSSPAWASYLKSVLSEVMRMLQGNYTTAHLLKNSAFIAYHKARMWKNAPNLVKKYRRYKETKKVAAFLKLDDSQIDFDLICETAAALHYEPKAAQKPIKQLAKKTGKKPSDIEKYIAAKFRGVSPSA